MSARKLMILFFVALAMLTGCTKNTDKPIDNNTDIEDKPSGNVNDNSHKPDEEKPLNNNKSDEDDDYTDIDEILEVDKIMFIENIKEYMDNDDYSQFETEETGQMAKGILNNYLSSDSYEYDKPITVEENRFVNAGACIEAFDKKTIGDITGVSIESVMSGLKIREARTYIVVGKGNFTVGVALENLKNGMLYKDENGSYCVKFDGMSDKTIVKDVIYISVEQ